MNRTTQKRGRLRSKLKGRAAALDEVAYRKRLRDVLGKDYGGSRKAFAKAVGAYQSRLSAWIPKYGEARAEKSLPSSAALFAICKATGRSADWLLFGDGPEYRRISRSLANLKDDLQIVVAARVLPSAEREGAGEIVSLIQATDLVETLVRRVKGELVSNASQLKGLKRLESLNPERATQLRELLQRRWAHIGAPEGSILDWNGVTRKPPRG